MQSQWTTTVVGNTLEKIYQAAGEEMAAFFGDPVTEKTFDVSYDIKPGTEVTGAGNLQPQYLYYVATVTVVW